MRALLNHFLRGVAVIAPLAVTGYVCRRLFSAVDSWLGLSVPGAGFVATIGLVVAVGFVTGTALEHLGLGGRVAVYLPMRSDCGVTA